MLTNTIKVATLLTLLLTGLACSSSQPLTATLTNTVSYQCEHAKSLDINYFNLSDNSLAFIKFSLEQGPEITLAQQTVASGSAYSNQSIKWWVKGKNGDLQVFEDGVWQPLLMNCTET